MSTKPGVCPKCGNNFREINGKFGPFYGCKSWPKCDMTVSIRKGTPAKPTDQKTRDARKRAHDAFDGLWKSRLINRYGAYKWLQDAMGLSEAQCHMQLFNEEQCRKVTRLAKRELKKLQGHKTAAIETLHRIAGEAFRIKRIREREEDDTQSQDTGQECVV